MNIYLLELVGKWLSVAFVSVVSFFNINVYQEESIKVEYSVKGEETINVINKEVDYPTVVNSNVQIEQQPIEEQPVEQVEQPVVQEVTQIDQTEEVPVIVEEPSQQISEEVSTEVTYEEFVGRVTGYGPDCYGCSGVGNVACRTKDGNLHNLYANGIYYNDETYGSVRIVAAAKDKFPCGTIIEVTKDGVIPITVVVLDRGGDMNKAWNNEQYVWLDLAYDSSASAKLGTISGRDIKFSVKRWGW